MEIFFLIYFFVSAGEMIYLLLKCHKQKQKINDLEESIRILKHLSSPATNTMLDVFTNITNALLRGNPQLFKSLESDKALDSEIIDDK